MNKESLKYYKRPGFLKIIKEFIRINRIKDTPLAPIHLATCWLRLQFSLKKNKSPFTERIDKIRLYTPSHYDFIELFDEIFLVNAYYIDISEKIPVIIDCGGNCGFATIYFKLFSPEAKIITFEPNPEVFKLLRKNIETNNFKNVELVDAACGKENSEINFFINEGYSLASSTLLKNSTNTIKVKQICLSDYINSEISLLKLDVEGAEFDVIKNLITTNKLRLVKRLAIEYHHRLFSNEPLLGSFLKLLEENAFDYNLFAYRKNDQFFCRKWQSLMIYAYRV